MHKADWKYLNTLPIAIRKKTTPELKEAFTPLHEAEIVKMIERDDDEIKDLLRDDNSLFYYIRGNYHFSTMNGIWLMHADEAQKLYKKMLCRGTLEYANTVMTVYFDQKWQSLKDVAKML